MSVDQMETYYTHATSKDDFQIGLEEDVTQMEAPLGLGIAETGTNDKDTEDLGTTNTQKMTFSRGSESHYTVSINFTYDISTSQDPRIAGHLSDVIVGGGIDLVVSEAVQVAANITTNLACIFAFDTYLWHPGKATTYILPVIEIEDIINRLTRIRNDLFSNDNNPIIEKLAGDQTTVVAQLNKQLDNWNTVLSNYRSHNSDMYSAFKQEQDIVEALMKTYQKWQTNIVKNKELSLFVAEEVEAVPFSIKSLLLSGSSSQATSAMIGAAKSFEDFSISSGSLSDTLSSLANPSASRLLSLVSQSSRSLQSTSPVSVKLFQLSDMFGTLSDDADSVSSALTSLVTNSHIEEFIKITTLIYPNLQFKFVNKVSEIQEKVDKLNEKIQSLAEASSLAEFAGKVVKVKDLQVGLTLVSQSTATVVEVLNEIASAAQSISGGLASTLSGIASFFSSIGDFAAILNTDLNDLPILFPSPTAQMFNSLETTAANLTMISNTVGQLSAAVTQIAGSFPTIHNVSNIPLPLYLAEFANNLTSISIASAKLSKQLGILNNYASELTPFSSQLATASKSSVSIASTLVSYANKLAAKLQLIEGFFKKIYASASSSTSIFASQLSSSAQTVSSLINSVVPLINSISLVFQQLYSLAGSSSSAGPTLTGIVNGLNQELKSLIELPQFLTSLPPLLIKELIYLFPASGLKTTLEISINVFSNITAAGPLVPMLQSLTNSLPSSINTALAQPIAHFGKVITPVSTAAASISTLFATLLSSSMVDPFIDFLALVPESATLLNDLSSINSKLAFVATTLSALQSDLKIALISLTVTSPLESIEGVLSTISGTIDPIAADFQLALTYVATLSTDVSSVLQSLVVATKTVQTVKLPSSLATTLKQLQSFFYAFPSKSIALSTAFGALSSPLSALKSYITSLLISLMDLSTTVGGISSASLSLSNGLPTYLSGQFQEPLSLLSTACNDFQLATSALFTSISSLSATPLLNFLQQYMSATLESSISSACTKLISNVIELQNSLTSISTSLSLSNVATEILVATSTKLASISSSLFSSLSSISDVTMQLETFFSKLSSTAAPIPNLASFVSSVSSQYQIVSSSASSLAGAISSLDSALSSSLSLSIVNSQKVFGLFETSSAGLSEALTIFTSSLPVSISSSLSSILTPLSSALSTISEISISIASELAGPVTQAVGGIFAASPDGSAQLATYLNSVVSEINFVSNAFNGLILSLPQSSMFSLQTLDIFYSQLIAASTQILAQLAQLTNDAQGFTNLLANILSKGSSTLSGVSSLLNPVSDLFTKLSADVSMVISYLQSLISPFSTLSPPIASMITGLSSGSQSIHSVVVSVTTLSSQLSSQYPFLPTLAANLTLLSGYANNLASDLTTLAASPTLSLVSNILSSHFPDLSSLFSSLANELNYLTQYFSTVSSDLSIALQTSQSILSSLSVLLKSFSVKLLSTFSGLSSTANLLSFKLNSVSQAVGSTSSFLQLSIASLASILLSLSNTAISLMSSITSVSSPISPLTRSLQLAVSVLSNYSTTAGELSAASYALSSALSPPQSLALASPLSLFAGTLNQTSEISILIAQGISPLMFLSPLFPAVSKNLSSPLQTLLNELSPHLENLSINLHNLSSITSSQVSISTELAAFSETLNYISSSVFNDLKTVSDMSQRLSHVLTTGLLPGSSLVPLLQAELLSLSHSYARLSTNSRNVTQSLNALTIPFSSLSSDISSTIYNLAHLAVTVPSGSSFAPQLAILSSALCTLSASPSMSAYLEVSSQFSPQQSAAIPSAISQFVVNSTTLRSILLSPNSTVHDEVAALGQFATSLSKISLLTALLSSKASTILSPRSTELAVLLSDVSKTFRLSAKSVDKYSNSLGKNKRRSLVAGLSPSKGILLATMEVEIAKGESLQQNVPSYVFGNQNFEGGAPRDWQLFYSSLESECDLPTALDGSTPISYDAICQKRAAAKNADIPGGYKSTSKDSLMAFLEDPKKLITFSANAAVSLSWSSSVSGSSAYKSTYEYSSDDDSEPEDVKLDNDIEGVDIGGDLETDANFTPVKTVHIGKNINNQESHVRTVSVRMSDADNGDYFAVRVTEDPIYATPIFFTEGGQSKCPGESGTNRRESMVKIVEVLPRCGSNKNQICDESTLIPGEAALFGVVIQNLSPTQDEVYYTLGFSHRFDIFHRNAYEAKGAGQCGTPYQKSGLVASFSQTDLQRIPYNVLIEVPITVTQGPLCTKYNSIEVQIIATCEIPTSESQVFQYGIVNGAISYDEADKIFALNDTATFSVAWPDQSSQRRTEETLSLHLVGNQSTSLGSISATIESLIENKHDLLATFLQESLATSLKEDHNKLSSKIDAKLEAHEILTLSINSKFDTIVRIAVAVVAFFGFVFIVGFIMLFHYLSSNKRTDQRIDDFRQFRMA